MTNEQYFIKHFQAYNFHDFIAVLMHSKGASKELVPSWCYGFIH